MSFRVSVIALALASGCALSHSEDHITEDGGIGDGDIANDVPAAPEVALKLLGACPGGAGACPVASPQLTLFEVIPARWRGTPHALSLVDNCGGRVVFDRASLAELRGRWLPPTTAATCVLEARATTREGAVGRAQVALQVEAGAPIAAIPASIAAKLYGVVGNCVLTEAGAHCGEVPRNAQVWVAGSANADSLVEVADSCVGARPWLGTAQAFGMPKWPVTAAPGASCSVTVRVTSLSGDSRTVAGSYQIAN
jgi:hypothetical protein